MSVTYKTYEIKSIANRTHWTMNFCHKVQMEEPKHRLQLARERAGFKSPTEAARAYPKKLNVNTLISNENGNRDISKKAAEKYAKLFDVKAGWLLYGETSGDDKDRVDVDVPLLSTVAASNLRDQPGVGDHDVIRRIKVGELPRGDWIALQVEGDSMNRVAPDGSIILVDRSDDILIDGRYYIFSLDGGEATFKMFKRSEGNFPNRMVPYSTNPDHMAMPADRDDLYVFGRVKRIIQDV